MSRAALSGLGDRARRRLACDGCSELAAGGVCSGFALQAAIARRYQDQLALARMEEIARRGGPAPGRESTRCPRVAITYPRGSR